MLRSTHIFPRESTLSLLQTYQTLKTGIVFHEDYVSLNLSLLKSKTEAEHQNFISHDNLYRKTRWTTPLLENF